MYNPALRAHTLGGKSKLYNPALQAITLRRGGSVRCISCPAGTTLRQVAPPASSARGHLRKHNRRKPARVSLAIACRHVLLVPRPAGRKYSANRESCQTCPAGKYSAAGAATCTSCPSGQGSLPGSSSCVTCNDQPWTWQKCNNNQCPKAANKNSAGDCKCKKAHNWSRRKQKCVKK